MKKAILAALLVTGTAFAQTEPKPTPVQQLAIQEIRIQQQQLQAEFAAVSEEIAKMFPGFHLDPQTMTIVKDAPPAKEKK